MITKGSERVAVGKFLLRSGWDRTELFTGPWEVVRAGNTFHTARHVDIGHSDKSAGSGVKFVCDTVEEARQMLLISQYHAQQYRNLRAGCDLAIEQLMEQSK